MADNRYKYGFRFYRSIHGSAIPQPVVKLVADAYQAAPGGTNVHLGAGDPVSLVNDGTVALTAAGSPPWGIVIGVKQYWDGDVIRSGEYVPGGTSWGTLRERATELLVVPADQAYWAIIVDDAVTATTRAAYQAFIGENTDHSFAAVASGRAHPKLDISDHATTESLPWRIEDISDSQDNVDFSGANVELIVRVNDSLLPGQAATAIVGT